MPDVVRECGEAGVAGAVIISAGFRETGREGAELERRVDAVAGEFDGFRILGPNCLGFLVPSLGLNASFARARPLDGHIALVSQSGGRPVAAYSHLAIRPYPEELTTQASLDDGTPLTLRPIRPEDEPLWHEMLAASSEESIRSRFRGLFKHTSHEAATRYCFIDYDREMAIVAEAREDGRTRLLGVGRIVANPDRTDAEYAVLIADPWQGRGLAGLLTDRCLEVAREWGVSRVWAETGYENRRMLAVMRRRGFAIEAAPEEGAMRGTLELGRR